MINVVEVPLSALSRLRLPPICAASGAAEEVDYDAVWVVQGQGSDARLLVRVGLSVMVGVITGLLGVAVIVKPDGGGDMTPTRSIEVPYSKRLIRRRDALNGVASLGLILVLMATFPAILTIGMSLWEPPRGGAGPVVMTWALVLGVAVSALIALVIAARRGCASCTEDGHVLRLHVPNAAAAQAYRHAVLALPASGS